MMRKNRTWGFILLLLPLILFSFSHCALFEKAPKVQYPNPVTPEAEAVFSQAEKKFNDQKYSEAASGFQSYLARFPYNRLSDEAMYRLGQIEMLGSHYAEATQTFNDLMQKTPDPSVASRAAVKAGISEYRLKNDAAAMSYFRRVEGQYLRDHDLIKTGGLALLILERQNAPLEKKGYYYALLADGYQGTTDATLKKRYGNEAPSRAVVVEQIRAWATAPANPGEIDRRFFSYHGPVSGPFVDYKLGMAYYRAGDSKKARQYLGHLVSHYGNTALAREARPVLNQIGFKPKGAKGEKFKVGVILPLSGKYEQFGKGTLNGMECAVGARAGCSDTRQIQLVVRDDSGNPADAIRAVEDLVRNEGVQVIVGPLSSASALAAAKRAQELGVVMISLAQKEGIPEVGPDIFRFSLTPDQQVKALLSYVIKKRGKKQLAVLYPNNNYGKVMMDKFKELAPAYGAQVTATQAYHDSRDVSGDIRNLKFSVSKSSPEAPLGFNAIFIPDSYASVLNIVPQLKVSGLESMLLLGTNAWNDSDLAAKSGGELGDVLFVDIYFKGSRNNRVRTFVSEYQAAYGQTPTTLEAMGYDIIGFIDHVVKGKRIKNPGDFRNALANASDYDGVTGLRTFASNREARIRPFFLTVKNSRIEEVN